ncbi:MAG TPA: MFS transporter [Candidatus Limnocylindrales bacterium]|nr:MFS transporter [Candidatus Limnocylindrales bacterium]
MPSPVISFIREQSAAVWTLQLGMLVNFFGNGLVAPFLVLYLHFARGLPIVVAGAAIATGGLTAMASGFLAGWSADRFGPKATVVVAMLCNAIAYALYVRVSEVWHAFAVAGLVGVGTGMFGPSQQSLVTTLVRADQRHRVFTQNRMFSLVGLGLGGIVGGFIAAGARPSDYETLLTLDVITFVAFAFVLERLRVPRVEVRRSSGGGYGAALRDRSLVQICAINLALVGAGIAPMLVLMPAYAKLYGGVGEGTIGLIYAANTLTILFAQIPITRFSEGRRRMRLLAFGSALWCVAWAVMLAGAAAPPAVAAFLIGAAVVIYGIGECLYSAVVVPTVAAIAPEHVRGRYLAVMGFSWQGGFMLGPAIGGALLAVGPAALPLAFGTVIAIALAAALSIERGLPREHARQPRVAKRASSLRGGVMKWITREHPHVDRVACPWLIEKFVDKDAEFLYVASDRVMSEAAKHGATPYDVKDVELGHKGAECSFDAFVRKYGLLSDPAMAYMAKVIRGADTGDKTITPESVGVEALLDGLRHLHYPDDQKQRVASRTVLDALYAYCQQKVAAA